MSYIRRLCAVAAGLVSITALLAQTITAVPRWVRFSSVFHPENGTGAPVESATFSIYAQESGGAPLWQETQNVTVDGDGRYNMLLGSTRNEGLPADLFASAEPRWLGVQFHRAGETEQPRVLLANVLYALKAADAETLGGRPASAYLLDPSAISTGLPAAGAAALSSLAVGTLKNTSPTPKITSGTPGNIGMFTNATDLGNSIMFQNGTRIGVGLTMPADAFHVGFSDTSGGITGYAVQNFASGPSSYSGMLFYDQNGHLAQFQGFNNNTHEYRINNIATSPAGSINFMLGSSSKFLVRADGDLDAPGSLRKNGSLFLHTLGSAGSFNLGLGSLALSNITTGTLNTGIGNSSLLANMDGGANTAVGYGTLANNSSGSNNTAMGSVALNTNGTGSYNTAVGWEALTSNSSGHDNVGIGAGALFSNIDGQLQTAVGRNALLQTSTGCCNTALGAFAGSANNSGYYNTAIGYHALISSLGNYNVALGYSAGSNIVGYNNVNIANAGMASDTNVIRIGTGSGDILTAHQKFFVAAVRDVTTDQPDIEFVVIDSHGQLGSVTSSRRYKEDIQDMGDLSSDLMRLRPVSFRYKRPYADGSKPLDYGLIAEEVAEVYPDLVATGKDGQVQSVQYPKLIPMLLNEVQKQNEMIHALQNRLAEVEAQLKSTTTADRTRPTARESIP